MKTVRRHLDGLDAAPLDGPAERGVVLVHLGGADVEEELEAFHLSLWSDPALAPRKLTSLFPRRRAEKAWAETGEELSKRYHLIGGRSPVKDLLEAQALAVENRLLDREVMAPREASDLRVVVGTVHGSPIMDEAVARLVAAGVERVAAIPMYVHDDPATTRRSTAAFVEAWRAGGNGAPVAVARGFAGAEAFVEAMIARVRRAIDLVPPDQRDGAFLMFTMHSPPESAVDKALLKEVEATAHAVMKACGFGEDRAAVAFQTLGAPGTYLQPEVEAFAIERAKAGVEALVVAPLSFVTDGFETLSDLDVRVYQAAAEEGVKQYRRVPTMNADPAFVEVVARLAADRLEAAGRPA